MTWPWRICFSLLAALPALAGVVTGSVQLTDSRESSVRRNRDFSGVVVWLEPVGAAKPLAPRRVEMVQKDKRFTPHVLAIPVGGSVEFPNFDPIFHNAFSSFAGQPFDVGLYPPGTTRTVTFRREGIVRVFCNIHPSMSAVITVLRSSWFAVTGHSGRFQIEDVPPGEYDLRVFHERATPARLDALKRRLRVGPQPLSLGILAISETGYLALPHKNKYGHDYPPPLDDRAYPGARK